MALLLLHAICPAMRRGLFPNSYVDIYITVLEHDGSILPFSIIAASLSLVQARIEMLDSVVACSAIWAPEQRLFLVDPSTDEAVGQSVVTLALMPNLGQLTQLHVVGKVDIAVLSEAIATCTDAARVIYDGVVHPLLLDSSSE